MDYFVFTDYSLHQLVLEQFDLKRKVPIWWRTMEKVQVIIRMTIGRWTLFGLQSTVMERLWRSGAKSLTNYQTNLMLWECKLLEFTFAHLQSKIWANKLVIRALAKNLHATHVKCHTEDQVSLKSCTSLQEPPRDARGHQTKVRASFTISPKRRTWTQVKDSRELRNRPQETRTVTSQTPVRASESPSTYACELTSKNRASFPINPKRRVRAHIEPPRKLLTVSYETYASVHQKIAWASLLSTNDAPCVH